MQDVSHHNYFFSTEARIKSAIKATVPDTNINITLKALISGFTPVRMRLKISMGKVVAPLPAVKQLLKSHLS
jgi:hypothetical protein